ncbi:MAG: adenosylhomocysteinase [Frankiaceae bacterium]
MPTGTDPVPRSREGRTSDHDVLDLALAGAGRARIEWADGAMPVLRRIRERFAADRPLDGMSVAACLHVTPETAVLLRTLRAAGAEVTLAASNPLSTQDDVAAALVADEGVAVFARSGVDRAGYYAHIEAALASGPRLVLDDACDLVNTLHTAPALRDVLDGVAGGCEETTTGVIRLREMARAGVLRFPVVAVNDTRAKRLLDNRYGTGQSTIDAVLRATNRLLAGSIVVVAGYGSCGQGVATRARGLGAQVLVTEVDPIRALEATMEGYRVLPMATAAPLADVVITATGDRDVVRAEHLAVMKDGAVLVNAGHFDVEIDVRALAAMSVGVRRVRPHLDAHRLADGRTLLLVAEGRVANLAAAEGNPATVMDVAFADQALSLAWLASRAEGLAPGVHDVPAEIDAEVAALELAVLGVTIDELTAEQRAYLSSWVHGS